MKRKQWLLIGFIFLIPIAVFTFLSEKSCAAYPDRPITFLFGWPAGGGNDITTRPLVQAASRALGQPILIEYHPGGSSAVAMGMLKSKKPDGYVLGHGSISGIINQYTRKVPYDFVRDFVPIIQYTGINYGLAVRADSPWKSLGEFINYAKANPGKIRYSSSGPGTPQALVMASLAKHFKLQWTHIPFEGGPPSMAAILGGHVEALTATMYAKPHVLAGRLRLLASYGEKRIDSFPDVPTLKELGIPIVAATFLAIVGPKGLSPEKVETLHQAFKKGMEDPDFIKSCDLGEQVIVYRNPQDTEAFFQKIDEEMKKLSSEMKAPSK
jgi:tripartite-type tricarboxylate transporter receptor subunit TctC